MSTYTKHHRNYYEKNRELIIQRAAQYEKDNWEKIRERKMVSWRKRMANPEARKRFNMQISGYTKTRHRHLKAALFDILGRKCSNTECLVPNGCADMRCLQIDHIHNDGTPDRARFKSTDAMLRYYIDNPDEAKEKLQVLCANCNWIKNFDFRFTNYFIEEITR